MSVAKQLIVPKNISKMPEITRIVKEHIETNIDWIIIAGFVLDLRDVNNIEIETYTLKTHSKIIDGIWYEIIDEENLEFFVKKLNSEVLQ